MIAILGIIAAVVIPNAAGFMATGTLNAANTEVANVKTAATGYMAEHDGNWPADSSVLGDYFEGGVTSLKAVYTFGDGTGYNGTGGPPVINVSTIKDATPIAGTGWSGIEWDAAKQQWKRD